MVCPKCGTQNLDTANVCRQCKTALTPENEPILFDRLLPYAVGLITVVALIGAAFMLLSSRGASDDTVFEDPPVSTDTSPKFTAVSVLAGGLKKDQIDPRVFTIISAGIDWSELETRVFPGSEVEKVMIYQEDRGLSVGLGQEPPDPSKVDALWREIGQPDRKRPLYFIPIGEPRNKELEVWLREKLTGLGFQLTKDRSKAREGVMLTLVR